MQASERRDYLAAILINQVIVIRHVQIDCHVTRHVQIGSQLGYNGSAIPNIPKLTTRIRMSCRVNIILYPLSRFWELY